MRVRSRLPAPRTDHSWVAWALAAAVTLLLFLSVGLPIGAGGRGMVWRAAGPLHERPPAEQVVFQTVRPPVPPGATRPPEPIAPAVDPPPAAASTRPAVTPPALPPRARDAPDSVRGAVGARQPSSSLPAALRPPRTTLPRATIPTPARGTTAAAACTAPCLAAARVGFSEPQHDLTDAERDSVLHALTASIPAAAAAAGGGAGNTGGVGGSAIAPPRSGGTGAPIPVGASVSIPLPGGGPTRAQRKRDSTVNAQVLPILERLRLRADSLQAKRRRDSLEALAKHRRDSMPADTTRRGDSTSARTREPPTAR